MSKEIKGAKDMPPMSVSHGTMLVNKTGSWRSFRPIVNKDKCVKCMLCFTYCPDVAISEKIEIDYDYCKGCGICAHECPTYAIEMVEED
jgi:2-oxoacid:acceptor oxidoreductase delta subunit (pyruvate/2-ketoisovalerate family)